MACHDAEVTRRAHVPRPEGDEPWLHVLPSARVVEDRVAWMCEAVAGRSVAHLGFADVGCEASRERDGTWLHAALGRRASRLVGLDVAANAVDRARSLGYEAHEVDCTDPEQVQTLGLGVFDIVVAGEIIEHVDNPAGLLEAARALAADDGKLLVTTPNARRLVDVVLAARGREVIHPDHVAIYSIRTLIVMLRRHGWNAVDHLVYLNPDPVDPPRNLKAVVLRLIHKIEKVLVRTRSPYVADGLIVVAAPQDDDG